MAVSFKILFLIVGERCDRRLVMYQELESAAPKALGKLRR